MGRILAIDYGRKRCGVAVTDVLGIAANGLPTVRSCDLESFLIDYCGREPIDRIIVGLPKNMDGTPSESMRYIQPFLNRLAKILPNIPVEMYDERFTSRLAERAIAQSGLSQKRRREKGLIDETAAVIILTDWLTHRSPGSSLPPMPF